MMARVDFFYDFVCPYAYLAHTQIESTCARAGAELVWKPFLLGGVFKAIGAQQGMPESKARHNLLDMHRWADHFGVPLRMPANHPNRTVLALRAAIAAGPELARASRALFSAYWALAHDLSDAAVVRDALSRAELDGAGLVARAETTSVKEELRARTDEAIAAGVFGAPTFVVTTRTAGGEQQQLFWGQDRLVFVDKALHGWRAPSAGSGKSVLG